MSTPKTPRSLTQFVKDQKRAGCPVCKLPPEAREQLRGAADKKITIDAQTAWIAAEFNVTIDATILAKHKSERHDTP